MVIKMDVRGSLNLYTLLYSYSGGLLRQALGEKYWTAVNDLVCIIHTSLTGLWQQSWAKGKQRDEKAGKTENVTICSPY